VGLFSGGVSTFLKTAFTASKNEPEMGFKIEARNVLQNQGPQKKMPRPNTENQK